MNERIDRILRRLETTKGKVGRTMWPMVFTDTLLDLLPTKGTFSHEELRLELVARRERNANNQLLADAYGEAIAQLDAHAPKGD